jgi:hypothetical protein
MRMTQQVLTFAQSAPDLFTMFEDYWKEYQHRDQKKQTNFDTTISFDEKEHKLNARLIKEIIKRSGVNYANETNLQEWFFHPLVVHESFAVIGALIDFVLPETIIDSIGAYTDVRVIGWGDSAAFDIAARDVFVVSKAGRGQRNSEVRKQFKGQVTIIPEFRQITVAAPLYRILAGTDSLAEFVAKAVRGLETQMTLDAYTAFAAAMAGVDSTATTGLLVAGYSQAGLVRVCEQVSAWNGGAKAMIMGTSIALLSVLPDDANYRYTLDDDYVKLGYIPTMAGYDILRLPQVAKVATPFDRILSDTTLWVVSPGAQKILKLVLEGNTISNSSQPYELANLRLVTTLTKSWGVAVCTNAVAGEVSLP